MIKISLIGNPNVGKTSLFNRLTRSFEHVGNWHGVTVDKKEKSIIFENQQIVVCDLPGLYSLTVYSPEEAVSRDNVLNNDSDLVIYVCDVNNLARNLYLALQLIERGVSLMIAVNMMDELAKQGKTFDCFKLESRLGVPVVAVSAKYRRDCQDLLGIAVKRAQSFKKAKPNIKLSYFNKLQLNQDEMIKDNAHHAESAALRYAFIDDIMHGVINLDKTTIIGKLSLNKSGTENEQTKLSKIDRIVLNKYLALPVFMLIMATIFFLTFGSVGKFLSVLLSKGINAFIYVPATGWLNKIGAPEWVCSGLGEGIINGMGGILAFLPQLLMLFLFLAFLEDSGYISRLAFMTDGLFRKIGLSGRSVFTMLIGFGCSASAILTARGLEDDMTRKKTVLLTPFMSCSAKLPVFSAIAGSFFSFAPLIVFLLYCSGAAFAILFAAIMQRIGPLKSGKLSFIMEIPPYRFPTLERVFQLIWHNIKTFLIRVATVVFALNVIVWVLSNFSLTSGFITAQSQDKSIMQTSAGFLAVLFKPLGFGDWRAVAALLSGIIAKEAVVSSMESLGGIAAVLGANPLTAVCFLVFTLLYVPCIATLAAIRKEAGFKWAAFSFLLQTAAAYSVTLIVHFFGLAFMNYNAVAVSAVICIAVAVLVMLCVKRLIKNGGRCTACGDNCAECKQKAEKQA